MSLIKINPDDLESFTIVTNPSRTYVSSSSGVTGSVYVFARRSSIEKDTFSHSAFIDTTLTDSDINVTLSSVQSSGKVMRNAQSSLSASFYSLIDDYMSKVNSHAQSERKQKVLDVSRFTPSYTFTTNTVKKLVVKENLMDYYRTSYPSAHWAYTNYHSLNFFTSSHVPTSSVLLYPNIPGPVNRIGHTSGTYSLSGAFSFDFYINPRYKQDAPDLDFKAGTIFHLSSSYAVSLVSGSAKDENGKCSAFRLKLQLSHSADVSPSLATLGSYPNDLIFLSDDNCLKYNNWHHVIIRWGTNTINAGTGSFLIDGTERGTFVIPSGTISPYEYTGATSNPDVLCIGNFYEGTNRAPNNNQAYFFATDPALRDGLNEMIEDASNTNEPASYSFNHPLNAEVHDLSIKRYYMSDADVEASASVGPKYLDDWTAFYLPAFFVQEAPFRQYVNDHGGILQTPFFEVDGTTNDPFNVAMSFGVAGHYMNIENFLRDFASDQFPRVHHMSGTAIPYTTTARSANEFLYDDPFVRRRNTFIMPCDDGLFIPSYELLASESIATKFIDGNGAQELSLINLDNLLLTSSLLFGNSFEVNNVTASAGAAFVNESVGFTPENPGTAPGSAYNNYIRTLNETVTSGTFDAGVQEGAPLTIYQRTLDASSNQVTFFSISNLYYGMRIHPKTFMLRDSNISGSGGPVGITLRDDGRGNIYRADCLTSASTWNSVGNIFYDEGIVVIKSPHLYFFGKEQYEMSFKGEQNVHAMKVEVLAKQSQINSSSNPAYMPLSASGYVADTDPNFVYITNINFHDKDLNVIAKTQLAQPIVKRSNDRILFKCSFDW